MGLLNGRSSCQIYKPKVDVGHVIPNVPLKRVKDRLALVRGALVEAPIVRWALSFFVYWLQGLKFCESQNFLIDEKDFTEGPDWIGLNPTLPIYI
jgi:phospholipase D1/2